MVLMPGCGCASTFCGCDQGTSPPNWLTLTFSDLVNRTHSKHAKLSFSAPFGSGAEGVVESPGGCDDNETAWCGASNRGPITAVTLYNGGSGYAEYGRSQPEFTLSASPGAGATLTATLVENEHEDGRSTWSIESIGVSGGTGYKDGSSLSIQFDGCACRSLELAAATLHTTVTRSQPTLTAATTSGNPSVSATLAVTLASNEDEPETWSVSKVGVTAGGSGYSGSTVPVAFTVTDGTQVTAAAATATIGIDTKNPPALSWASSGGSGTGFVGSATFKVVTQFTQDGVTFDPDGLEFWTLDTLTIADGGSGYQIGDELVPAYASPQGWQHEFVPYISVTDVDEDGAVLSFAVMDQGAYRQYTGEIESVEVTKAGKYYKEVDDGIPTSVTVGNGGEYYCTDKTATPIVADVTVTAGGGGTWAVITATVDDDTESATFGQITSLSVDDGGDGYLAWHWICAGHAALNGNSYNVYAADPQPLLSVYLDSCFGCGARLAIDGVDPATGAITGITVVEHGYGYAVPARVEPSSMAIEIVPGDTGTGAEFMAAWTEHEDGCGRPYWSIESITVSGEGTGYYKGQRLYFPSALIPPLVCQSPAAATINVPDDSSTPESVTVLQGGKYYKEDPSLPPIVSSATATIYQASGSAGSGVELEVVIDDEVGDGGPGFGAVQAVNVLDGGSGYTQFGSPRNCTYIGACDTYLGFQVTMYGGRPLEVLVTDSAIPLAGTSRQPIEMRFVGDVAGDCSSPPASATLSYGAPSGSVAIAPLGTESGGSCGQCACPADLLDGSVNIEITSDYPCNDGVASYSGPAQDLNFGCTWTDPATNITYESDLFIDFECCPSECGEGGACQHEMYAIISGTIGLPDDTQPSKWQSVDTIGGPYSCTGVTINNGQVNATLTITSGAYTFTIVLGDG